MALRTANLCAGYRGFELALRLAGVDTITVVDVERDAFAAATLVARMEGEELDLAPVWDDIATFDGAPWHGRVDLVTAGFPCQPFSAAGNRGGVDDDRWLWPQIARILGEIRPSYVILENVRGIIKHGLPLVLADLADLGFDAEWGLLSASAIGAPHKRERWWCLAWRPMADPNLDGLQAFRQHPTRDRHPSDGHDADRPSGAVVGDAGSARRPEVTWSSFGDEGPDGRQPHGGDLADGAGEAVANATGVDEREPDHETGAVTRRDPRVDPGGRGEDVADTSSQRRDEGERQESRRGPAFAEGGGWAWPPLPDDSDGWRRWCDDGGPEPSVRRGSDGPPRWLADTLHLGGNGLVPQCAAEAIIQLAERNR